jgi:hypothetical protein
LKLEHLGPRNVAYKEPGKVAETHYRIPGGKRAVEIRVNGYGIALEAIGLSLPGAR